MFAISTMRHRMQAEFRGESRVWENRTHGSVREVKGRRLGRTTFTLVELLVVIAIIGILASMLLPVMKNVRESAKSIQCLSTLKQTGLSSRLYQEDYRGLMAYYLQDQSQTWLNYLIDNNYVGDWRITRCPSYKPTSLFNRLIGYGMRHTVDPLYYPESVIVDVGPNEFYLCDSKKIKTPSVIYLFGDTYNAAWSGNQYYRMHHASSFGFHARHVGSGNLFFVDCHARGYTAPAMGELWKRDRASSKNVGGSFRVYDVTGEYITYPPN